VTKASGIDLAVVGQALTLAERLPAPGPAPGDLAPVGLWRAQEPFAQERWWQARLAEDGIDEDQLAALAAEPSEAAAARLATPVWAADLAAALTAAAGSASRTAPDPDLPFLAVADPLLAQARDRLAARLAGLADPRLDPPVLLEQLYGPVPELIHRMVERAAIAELHRERRAGRLAGGTPRARFAAFVRALGSAAGAGAFFARYPVLGRELAVGLRLWEEASAVFAGRLSADLDAIRDTFSPGRELGTVVAVRSGLGDRHRGWATVTSVRWASGLQVVYKPRPVAADVHFQQLLGWLNGRGLPLSFRTLTYLARDGYGWAEFVRPQPCAADGELHDFYRRQGGLLALLHVLHATDFHAENLIAAGAQPVLVDLESLFEPGFPVTGPVLTSAERVVADATRGSVLGVGLLPSRVWTIHPGRGADLSGLGQVPGVPTPLNLPVIVDAGTDQMRIVFKQAEMAGNDHRPVPADAPLRLLDYAADLLTGFTEVYRICQHERGELLAPGGPVLAFAGDEVRIVLRPTMWYGAMMLASMHPDLLRDGLARDRHFDRLWRMVPQRDALAGCVPAERRDLWQADVPVFTARTDSGTLLDSSGAPAAGVTLTPGLQRVRDRLGALSDDDLVRQQWLIRGSLGTTVIELSEQPPLPSYRPRPVDEPLTAPRLIQVADTLGDRLAKVGFMTGDSAQWLGVNAENGHTWSIGPLRPDLFHGLTGVALFFGWLGRMTGDPTRGELARKAMATACHQIDERRELGAALGLSGMPGAAYAACQLARLLGDEDLMGRAVDWIARVRPAIADDINLDFTTGSAGTIAAAAAVYRYRPEDQLLDVIAASAGRLLAAAQRHPAGLGWLPQMLIDTGKADLPIAGFGHGTAGIAWPLFLAGELLRDDRYSTAALAATRYEQALFRPELGIWAELRHAAALGVDAGGPPPVAWCYGAMGIGMGRVLSLPYLGDDATCRREIDAALATTMRAGFGQCHALCHGDIGNVELLLHAAGAMDRPELRDEARARVSAAVESAQEQGWVCGTPLGVETPGLMVGLAGAGYGLLRMAAPDVVPAVLALSP
jgi:type 2 lantibiotic biosynthesis protein LanM